MDRNYSRVLDVMKPNLMKEVFPYKSFPVSEYDKVMLPYDLPEDIWITDTTFRDGQQSMTSFTVEQIVTLFRFLNELDNDNGLIRQTEFFLYSKRDRDAIEKCKEFGFAFPEITGWIRPKQEEIQLAKEMEIKEAGMLMSCSDYHIFKKLKKNRQQTYNMYLKAIEKAISLGIKPRCHLEDITRADIFGFVIPLIKSINEIGKQANVEVKFRICDTLGVGKPFNGHKLPRSVPALIYYLKNVAGLNANQLEWHGHNDYYYCTANSTSAWIHGASAVSTTLLGIGERTGNCPLESMLVEYHQLKKPDFKIRFELMSEIADYFKSEFGFEVHHKMPFLGDEANSTRAGIHADGIMKNEEIYHSFDCKSIFNRPMKIVVNQYSGVAGIAGWINLYYDLKGSNCISKKDKRISQIKRLIEKEYKEGRVTALSDAEMKSMVTSVLGYEIKTDYESSETEEAL